MSDLTTRLREHADIRDGSRGQWHPTPVPLMREAAARIEALEAERASLIAAALDHRATASRALGREQDARAVIAQAQHEVNGLMDSLDDSVIADDDERGRVYEALRGAWTILTAPLSRVPQGAAEPSGPQPSEREKRDLSRLIPDNCGTVTFTDEAIVQKLGDEERRISELVLSWGPNGTITRQRRRITISATPWEQYDTELEAGLGA